MSTQLVLDALEQAVTTRGRTGSRLDSAVGQGVGDCTTSICYTERLAEVGIVHGYLNDVPTEEFEETFCATRRTDQPLSGIQ